MKEHNIGSTILGFLVWVYMIVSQIMAIVFFIQYCRIDSLLKIIFIDTWLSEIKGLLWILVIWQANIFVTYDISSGSRNRFIQQTKLLGQVTGLMKLQRHQKNLILRIMAEYLNDFHQKNLELAIESLRKQKPLSQEEVLKQIAEIHKRIAEQEQNSKKNKQLFWCKENGLLYNNYRESKDGSLENVIESDGGVIYLDETEISPEYPIHNYISLQDRIVSKHNPELWNRGVTQDLQAREANKCLRTIPRGRTAIRL